MCSEECLRPKPAGSCRGSPIRKTFEKKQKKKKTTSHVIQRPVPGLTNTNVEVSVAKSKSHSQQLQLELPTYAAPAVRCEALPKAPSSEQTNANINVTAYRNRTPWKRFEDLFVEVQGLHCPLR